MVYFVDNRINLSELARVCNGRSAAIRQVLIGLGLNFADANQFAMFAAYGFHEPTEKQTLSMRNKWRLSILDEPNQPRRKEPPAWNRL